MTTTPHVITLTPHDYLTQYRGWQLSYRPPFFYGLCPLHNERTPSFTIDTRDNHYHCYGCDRHGTVVRLIAEMEFGLTSEEDKPTWAKAFARAEELSGIIVRTRRRSGIQTMPTRPRNAPATPEQQRMMQIGLDWFRLQLWNEYQGFFARSWFNKRGANPYQLPLVGYAPPMNDPRLFAAFMGHLQTFYGKGYLDMAFKVGFLRQDGTARLSDRLIFACADGRDQDKIMYYMARNRDDQCLPQEKYLSAPSMQKYPFWLPTDHFKTRVPGTVFGESVKCPTVLHQYNVLTVALLGTGMRPETLLAFPAPYWFATDNDPAHIDDKGRITYPGDKLAEKPMEFLKAHQKECYRIRPPLVDNSLDEWVFTRGIEPLIREISPYLS